MNVMSKEGAVRVCRVALLTGGLVITSSCATNGGGALGETGYSQVVTSQNSLPAPSGSDRLANQRGYEIGPGDILVIDAFGIDGLDDRELTVDGNGQIAFPLAGTLQASGMTPTMLARAIEDRMRNNNVRAPAVTVNVKEIVSRLVTVDGQVGRPGLYPVIGNMTLTDAVASAQGLGEFAKSEEIVVLRTVDGQRYAALYNLDAIRRGNYPDPDIYADDLVVVGESRQSRLFANFLSIAPLLTTPIVLLLQN